MYVDLVLRSCLKSLLVNNLLGYVNKLFVVQSKKYLISKFFFAIYFCFTQLIKAVFMNEQAAVINLFSFKSWKTNEKINKKILWYIHEHMSRIVILGEFYIRPVETTPQLDSVCIYWFDCILYTTSYFWATI